MRERTGPHNSVECDRLFGMYGDRNLEKGAHGGALKNIRGRPPRESEPAPHSGNCNLGKGSWSALKRHFLGSIRGRQPRQRADPLARIVAHEVPTLLPSTRNE